MAQCLVFTQKMKEVAAGSPVGLWFGLVEALDKKTFRVKATMRALAAQTGVSSGSIHKFITDLEAVDLLRGASRSEYMLNPSCLRFYGLGDDAVDRLLTIYRSLPQSPESLARSKAQTGRDMSGENSPEVN